jgi:hypothetical protein
MRQKRGPEIEKGKDQTLGPDKAMPANTGRWLPFVSGIFSSVLLALPTAWFLFGTDDPFTKPVIETIYPFPSILLLATPAKANFVAVGHGLIFAQFAVYGFILSVRKDASRRSKMTWGLVAVHALGAAALMVYKH